jgi:hypothetical protein
LTLFGVGLGLSRLAGVWYWELSPVALTGIAATILLDLEVAWVLVAGLALMIGFRAGFSIYLFLGLGLGGVLAALIARRIHSWSQLYYCLFGVLLGNGIGFGISWLLDPKFGAGWLNGLGLSLLNGFASTLIAGLLISRSEEWFGVVNPLGIGRFLDLNHPLLQKLALEAPGSYQHSVVVGNLAEAGARAIGANPILAKVGGYFHDLGKLRKPQYFMENQAGADNPHDHLSPQLSALIITAHVRDGLEFARKLPRPIQEVIAQHHGTTTMELLYHKARRRRPTPTKYEYRYPGPKPSFREAALVMLADGVEAAARAEPRASAQHMRKLIKELVEARYEDGQLDESGLSRTDLLKIQEAFYSIILSIFHPRAQYPRP